MCFSCQAKLRLEMEMERLRQTHSKEIESKDDEVEEIRQSCSKKVNGVIVELAMWANTARSHLVVFSTAVCSDSRPRVPQNNPRS